jgi:selenocysteine lyase/cysteine desulfurase
MEAIQRYECGLVEKLIQGLLNIPGLTFYGITDPMRFDWRTPTVAVRLAGASPQQIASALGEQGVFTWAGNYYAISLTERLGVEASGGMLRLGLAHYNTADEVKEVLKALKTAAKPN